MSITNPTILTSINELAAMASAEATYTLQNTSNLANTIRRVAISPGQQSVQVPAFPSRTATALTEGDEVTNEAMSTTGPTLVPAVGAASAAFISDRADFAAGQSLAMAFGRQAGEAIIAKWNADIYALFAGFSQTLGGTGQLMTKELLSQAVGEVRQNSSYMGQLFFAAPIAVIQALVNDLISDNATVAQAVLAAVYSGQYPQVLGATIVPVTLSTALTDDSSGDTVCGLYSARAIAGAFAWESKVGYERRETAVGFNLVASSCYAFAESEDLHGLGITVANASVSA